MLLLLQVLLGPGVSLSLQEWLQLEGKLLLADAVRGEGAAAAAFHGAVGVRGEAAPDQSGFRDHDRSIVDAPPEVEMKPAVVDVLEGDKGMGERAGLSGSLEAAAAAAGAALAVRDRPDGDGQSNRQQREVVQDEDELLTSLEEVELVGDRTSAQQQLHGLPQPQQQPQLLVDYNLQSRQAQALLHRPEVTRERMEVDEPRKKRQREEEGYAVAEDRDWQRQEGLQQLQAEQLSMYPCSTASASEGVAARVSPATQEGPLQQQQPAQQQLPQLQDERRLQPEHITHQGCSIVTDPLAEWVGEVTAGETVAAADGMMRGRLQSMSSGNTGGVQLGSPIWRGSSNIDDLELVWSRSEIGQGSGTGADVMDQAANQHIEAQEKRPLLTPHRKVRVGKL